MTTYHLKPLLHWCSTLQVLGSCLNIKVHLFFTQIDHVAREERLAMLLEVFLIGIEKTVQPWQKLLGTVIGVQDDRNAVGRSDRSDILSTSNTASD